jgi:ribosomal protein S18 acetylase RimI-like enzyme
MVSAMSKMNKNLSVNFPLKLNNHLEVSGRWLTPEQVQWQSYEEVFYRAFSDVFKNFTATELDMKIIDKEQGIKLWFAEEMALEKKFIAESGAAQWFFLEIKSANSIIGYSIWHSIPNDPESVYQSCLCVIPQWQRMGAGTALVQAIKQHMPDFRFYLADVRKSAKNFANSFYTNHLKCVECAIYPDESLANPQNFTGYKGTFLSI